MPATDQTWRDQRVLHIVFAATSVLMLIATLVMFGADHGREWKTYQKTARRIDNTLTEWRLHQVDSEENRKAREVIESQMQEASATAVAPELLVAFRDEVIAEAKLRGEELSLDAWDGQAEELQEAANKATEERAKATAALQAWETANVAALEAKTALVAAQTASAPAAQLESLQKAADETARIASEATAPRDATKTAADAATESAAGLRSALVAHMESLFQAARQRETNVSTERKFKAADYDAARAKLALLVRDNQTAGFATAQADINNVKADLDALTLAREAAETHRKKLQAVFTQITEQQTSLQKALADNQAEQVRLANTLAERQSTFVGAYGLPGKRWLELPILDAFNSPLDIDNKWTKGLTQPVGSFGQVRRFDRCTTCHKSIDKTMAGSAVKPGFEQEKTIHLTLTAPAAAPPAEFDEQGNPKPYTLESLYGFTIATIGLVDSNDATVDFVHGESIGAKAPIDVADEAIGESGLRVGDVIAFVNDTKVEYPSRASELLVNGVAWGQSYRLTVRRGMPEPFASHPRLDLFVGSLSPHNVATMGCTVCHEGQGSGTEFKNVSHTPDTPAQGRDWTNKHGWFNNHHWIYPMFPARFAESSCLKCHHTVEELAPSDRFPEPPAPKLMAGHALIERFGCFGCHEINGYEAPGKTLGPDMRLEPNFYAAALALKADPGFAGLSDDLKKMTNALVAYPESNETRRAVRDFLLADAAAEEPVLAANSHKLEEALKDVEIPGIMRKTGPSLRYVGSKLGEPFLYDWIQQPNRYRSDTRMPQFFGHMAHLNADLQNRATSAIAEILAAERVNGYPSSAAIRQQAEELSKQAGHALDHAGRIALRQLLLQDRDALVERAGADASAVQSDVDSLTRWATALADDAEVFEPIEILGMTRYLLAKSQPFECLQPSGGYGEGDEAQIERGKVAFETRGCLACHAHADFPAGKADKGPNLTNIGDKFKATAGAPNGQAWVYSWVTLPSHYSARSTMPDLFLTPKADAEGNVHDPAADITAYLLASSKDWKPVGLPEIPVRDLDKFVFDNLRQMAPSTLAAEYLKTGIPEERAASLKGAEIELVGQMSDEKKLLYVGRKSIGKYGCYACHDIPGFENAKPIGTALADWGRKESSKLAFEHIAEYLHGHGHAHGAAADAHGTEHGAAEAHAEPAAMAEAHAEPFDDSFYMDQLAAGDRSGFIWQKLKEPRSYDYKRTENKRYDERLRMPLFPLNDEEREAVITFVLGLVAEPPAKEFVYQPNPRQKAIVDGRHVLRKYNCEACHILETEKWYLEFEAGALEAQSEVSDFPFVKAHLKEEAVKASSTADPLRATYTAMLRGLPVISDDAGQVVVWDEDFEVVEGEDLESADPKSLLYPMNLWEPAAIEGNTFEVGVAPLAVPGGAIKKRIPTLGGDLTWLLLPRVVELEKQVNPAAKGSEALGWLPPPLVGQGTKVQPEWMHAFLLDPHPIRPATFLRMPKFNMSPEEATKLVNYFAARDNANYPFEYDARTRPDHLALANAKFSSPAAGSGSEGSSKGHLGHAMQIVTSSDYCIKCHLVGNFVAPGSERALAPNLGDVQSRLRPDYIRRWIANPKKILPYTSMPVNIAYSQDAPNLGGVAQTLYPGTSIEQVDALVDLLMNYDQFLAEQSDIGALVREAAAKNPPAAPPATDNQ